MKRYEKINYSGKCWKIFMADRRIRTHDLDNIAWHCTMRHLYQLRYRDNAPKDCSNSTDIGIG